MANMTEAQTRGALIGATNSTRTGFMPSPYMELPYACFDELDKAKQIDNVIDPYMHGTIMHFTRGVQYPISPVVLCLANPKENDRYGIIHNAWRRRSVFMNTGGLPESARDMIDVVADMEDVPSGLLPMDSFTVPESLDDTGKAVIRASRELYTKGFQRIYCGSRSIELLALGCMAVTGCSPAVAAHHVVAHFATVASTIPGQLVPYASVAWKEVRGYLSNDVEDMTEIIRSYKPDASADLDRQIAEQREQEAIARDALRRLRAAKGILARRIEIAIRSLDTGNLPSTDAIVWRAITLQETLRALIPEIRDAVSEDEITDIERDIKNEINLVNGNQLIGDIQRAIEIQEIMLQREQWEAAEITQSEPLAIESADTRSANAAPGRAVQRMRESFAPLYAGVCAYKHLLGNVTAMYWIMPTRGYGYMATPSSRTPIVKTCAIHYQNGIDYAQKTGHEQYIILSGQSLRDFTS
jgi:hypothetical protein